MNGLYKNKFLRENLILVVVLALLFPPYAFSDVWVVDNDQMARIYKDGHAKTIIEVKETPTDEDVKVTLNPTALFYPGLKISFGDDRKNVYEILSIRYDTSDWVLELDSDPTGKVTADSPIYMELVRAGGFDSPVAVSANQNNDRCWIADGSHGDSSITQIGGEGRIEPADTTIVTPYYISDAGGSSFEEGDTMFKLYSQDKSIYPGIKMDFDSDNRGEYILEVAEVDTSVYPYILETTLGLLGTHSVIGEDTAIIHIDRFRDKMLTSPQSVSANSTTNRNSAEYDIAWVAEDDAVIKYEKWQYRRLLYIPPLTDFTIAGDLENFPLMVKLVDGVNFDYDHSLDPAGSGADIRFLNESGNALRYEIEDWNDGGTSIVWVKVPRINDDDTTIIYMYYGNSDASDAQDTENVWDENYMLVQHLQEDTALINCMKDSTYNNNDGTPYRIDPGPTIVIDSLYTSLGKINGACDFEGTNTNYVRVPAKLDSTLSINKEITIEVWVNGESFSDTNTIVARGIKASWSDNSYSAGLLDGRPIFVWGDQGSVSGNSSLLEGSWYYLAFVADEPGANALKIYENGEFEQDASTTDNPGSISAQLNIGTDGNANNFDGIIDEVRISNIARSDTWLKACFYSGNDELIDFGDEEEVSYGGVLKVSGFDSPQSISVNSSNGEVWVADTGDSEVVKLAKEGHKTIEAVVAKSQTEGNTIITLTDTSELDTGIKISFNDNPADAYHVESIISDTQIEITPGLSEALRGAPPQFSWEPIPQLMEFNSESASYPKVAMSGDKVVAIWRQNDGIDEGLYSNYSEDAGVDWEGVQAIEDGAGGVRRAQVAMDGDTAIVVWEQDDGDTNNLYFSYGNISGSTINWNSAQLLESGQKDAEWPQLAMSGNNAVAVWQQQDGGGTINIYYSYSTDGGVNWDSGLLDNEPGNAYYPHVAMDGDTVIAVWPQSDGVALSIYSRNATISAGTVTLGDTHLLEMSNENVPFPPGIDRCPVRVAVDGNNAVAVWYQNDGTTTSTYSSYSTDGGNSWIGPQLLEMSDEGVPVVSPPHLVIDGSNVIAVWEQYGGGGSYYSIYANCSRDAGATWVGAQLLETGSGNSVYPCLAMSGDNAVVVWFQNDGTSFSIYSNYSTDGGASWVGPQLLEPWDRRAWFPSVAVDGINAVAVWQQYDEGSTIGSIYSNHSIFDEPLLTIPVARELARISGFANPVSISVDSESGNCWVADDDDVLAIDGGDSVVRMLESIGDVPSSAGYNINTNSGYHKTITGFDDPVSVSADYISGSCWVACEGRDSGDSYIVKLESTIPEGEFTDSNEYVRIYGFNSPKAVSVEAPDGDCWVADFDNGQVVKLYSGSSENDGSGATGGHKYTGYVLDDDAEEGDDTVLVELEDKDSEENDTELYPPLKISFGDSLPDIETVYEVVSVTPGSTIIGIYPALKVSVSSGAKVYKELVRVDGFNSPEALSAFEGEDLGELGLHPWGLQIRELYVIDEDKFEEDDWHGFPNNTPVHDATPQFKWRYLDVDGSDSDLESYRIRIYTVNTDPIKHFEEVWDSGELEVHNDIDIYPGAMIRTDWDREKSTTETDKENDSASIYSSFYYVDVPDPDDCPDLSQNDDDNSDTGDRTYYVQLTVTNRNDDHSDTYPKIMDVNSPDTPIISFKLDKTPPGSYRVCGTESFIPVPSDNADNDKNNIKNIKGSRGESGVTYYQTDNYYWDEVWVQWDGGDSEIVREDSPWIPKKEVTVRVKVKDKNNENYDEVEGQDHPGHGANEYDEDDTDCSGVALEAEYRYRSTLMAPDEWTAWFDCDEIRLFDEDADDSQGEELTEADENRNTFVWLYAKNVKFGDGDTNLIQFRIKDEGNLEVIKDLGDTEVWIAPNMGYSHADTEVWEVILGDPNSKVISQTASNVYGYPIQIDTDIPEVILTEYPHNPYPHRFACFKWLAIDTTKCWYKYKLEYSDDGGITWNMDNDAGFSDDVDGEDFGLPPYNYDGASDNLDWQTGYGTGATSNCYTGLKVGRLYRFTIKAKDNEGQNSGVEIERQISDEVEWAWRVTPEVPDTVITYGPSEQTDITGIKFGWKGTGGTPPYEYSYKINGIGWQYTSSKTVDRTILEGLGVSFEAGKTYVFEVRAGSDMDNSGVVDPGEWDVTPARRTFTVVNPSRPPYLQVSPGNLYKYFREMIE